jgi:hypothetical protein
MSLKQGTGLRAMRFSSPSPVNFLQRKLCRWGVPGAMLALFVPGQNRFGKPAITVVMRGNSSGHQAKLALPAIHLSFAYSIFRPARRIFFEGKCPQTGNYRLKSIWQTPMHTKFVVKVNRGGIRAPQYVQRMDRNPIQMTTNLKLAQLMGRLTAEDAIKLIQTSRCTPELVSVQVRRSVLAS